LLVIQYIYFNTVAVLLPCLAFLFRNPTMSNLRLYVQNVLNLQRSLSLDFLLSLSLYLSLCYTLSPEGEMLEFGYSREGDFHWNEPANGRYRVRLRIDMYMWESSKRVESGMRIWNLQPLWRRKCAVGHPPPFRMPRAYRLCIPLPYLVSCRVFSQFRGRPPRALDIHSFIETSRLLNL